MHRRGHRRRRHGGGPMGMRGRFFASGEVRLALLSLLGDGPKHGYELMRALEERSDGAYRASAGTVYPTLQQLEDEGLARSDEQAGKRVYRLTAEGEREVEAEHERIDRIWRRAEDWGEWSFFGDPDAAEVVRPALRLARTAYRVAARAHGDTDVIERIRDILERAEDDLLKLRRSR